LTYSNKPFCFSIRSSIATVVDGTVIDTSRAGP